MLALENNHKSNSEEAHFSKLHFELYTFAENSMERFQPLFIIAVGLSAPRYAKSLWWSCWPGS